MDGDKRIDPPQKPEPVGISCPVCGCRDLRTTHTLKARGGRIKRYRQCRHCGRRLVTFELRIKDLPKDGA